MAHLRPSQKDQERMIASASVLFILGHEEDELAKAVSEILALTLNTLVIVTAGIHWYNIREDRMQKNIEIETSFFPDEVEGARIARNILERHYYDKDKIEEIVDIIE